MRSLSSPVGSVVLLLGITCVAVAVSLGQRELLTVAVATRRSTLVRWLLWSGALKEEDVCAAAVFGVRNPELLSSMLSYGQCDDASLVEALHAAAVIPVLESIKVLDAVGVNVSGFSSMSGCTAMHAAAQACPVNVTDVLDTLITLGGTLNMTCRDGATPLHMAALSGCTAVIERYRDQGESDFSETVGRRTEAGFTALHAASIVGNVPVYLEKMLQHNIDLGVSDRGIVGLTPLHFAARSGNVDSLSALIGAGADIHATAEGGVTAFHCAAFECQAEALKMLIKAGASSTSLTECGASALHAAAVAGCGSEVVDILLDSGIDCHIQTSDGVTAFGIADSRVMKLLEAHDCNVGEPDVVVGSREASDCVNDARFAGVVLCMCLLGLQ